ncbi:hypothetical protein ANOM_005080 [Aspergillus nomiae NRRL 13137]|uniref:Uncharacterized protein n=1 Tax=Aspergillus nomiae NRRL (strain ATCC 15546 / NRRL 13137 / CBS 260.88 / M93) TaxID=1509407 RepID=A0A0L1J3J9_ASPN3|nr:uncharacterized protein ANOM_005080 [Aspergillus nomiae NRRL 13137]KNG85983.1 hypothetical protein ANOM_005080 [Aspergillus nomiae NRRL 13137]
MADPQESLVDVVKQDKFFDISDDQFLDLLKNAFKTELNHLKNASPTVESGATKKWEGTPSQRIFGEDFHEVNRTLTSMLAVKWVIAGEYETFTSGQNNSKLQWDSFKDLRWFFLSRLHEPDDIYALIVAIAIDDIGKDKALAEEVAIPEKNHGEVLLKAVERGLVPALETVTDQVRKNNIIQSLRIGAKLDISQIVQGETVPHSMLALNDCQKLHEAFNIKAMVTFLDVGGAAAHSDPRGCIVMTQPIFLHYLKAINLLDQYRKMESPDWPECYDKYLAYRAYMLKHDGFASLSTSNSEDRALLRLLCMGRVETRAQAEQFRTAFSTLPDSTKTDLVNGLSVNGIEDGTAILPYYAPGILSEVLRDVPEGKLVQYLKAFMHFLAGVYDGSKPEPGKPGALEERDLAPMQDMVKSPEFKEHPEILTRFNLS